MSDQGSGAMRVGSPSWQAVAEWSGGEIVRGFGGRYLFIHFWREDGSSVKCEKGSWIARDVDGNLSFYTDPEFKDRA